MKDVEEGSMYSPSLYFSILFILIKSCISCLVLYGSPYYLGGRERARRKPR